MAFRVELSDRAQSDIAAIYDWLRSQQAGDPGERWFVAPRSAIASLSALPSRCPVAPESRDAPIEVRQLLYGRKPGGKTVLTDDGPLTIEVPRDREGSFEPRLIAKNERRFTGFDDKIPTLYERGMTVREIQGFLWHDESRRIRRCRFSRHQLILGPSAT